MPNNADVSFINISNVKTNSGEKNIDCNTNESHCVEQEIQCDLHVSIDQCDANSMHVTPDQNAYNDIIRCEWLLLASMVIDMFACYLLMEKNSIPSTWFTGKGFKCACLNITGYSVN